MTSGSVADQLKYEHPPLPPSPIDADGSYRSAVLSGFRFRVDWLWQRSLPPVGAVVADTEA